MAQIKQMETKCVLFAAQMSRALQETHAFCRTWAASFSLAQCPKLEAGATEDAEVIFSEGSAPPDMLFAPCRKEIQACKLM
jgi:hypothetical protein